MNTSISSAIFNIVCFMLKYLLKLQICDALYLYANRQIIITAVTATLYYYKLVSC